MALESPEEIQQFLVLSQKSNQDLRALCEGMELKAEGTREELIQRLLALNIQPQTDVFQPQLIALRTRFQGEEIAGAEEFMRRIRRVIYEGKNNNREFSILNGKNEPYLFKMRYAKLGEETRQMILASEMIYPHQSQRELVKMLKEDPNRFIFHIVNRQYGKDKTFIMLHVQPRS